MFSQAFSCSFPLQVAEELSQANPPRSFAAVLSNPKSSQDIASAIDELSIGGPRSIVQQLRVMNASVEAAVALASRMPNSRIAIACADSASARASAAIAKQFAVDFESEATMSDGDGEGRRSASHSPQPPASLAQIKLPDAVGVDVGMELFISASSRLVFTTAEALHLRLMSPHADLVFDYVIFSGLSCDDLYTNLLVTLLNREDAPPCVAVASCSAELPLPFQHLQAFEIPLKASRPGVTHDEAAAADVPDAVVSFCSSNPGACIAVFAAEPLLKLSNDIRARAVACNATLPNIKLLQPSLTASQLAAM